MRKIETSRMELLNGGVNPTTCYIIGLGLTVLLFTPLLLGPTRECWNS